MNHTLTAPNFDVQMQDDVERFDALPADGGYQSVAEPRAEPSVQLVVNLVDPNGTTVESHMVR